MRQNLVYNPAYIQRLQMFNLLSFMLIGKVILNFQITWFEMGMIVGFALVIEHIILYVKNRDLHFFSYSAINTSLGVIFLLRTTEINIYLLVVAIALLQKYLIRIGNHHFLNPSNVAVVVALSLFPYQTFTTPEQWGSFWWLGIVMMISGLYITSLVHRVLIPIVFMLFYVIINYLLITHNIYELFSMIISGGFLLFMFFMLTDPRTTPNTIYGQIFYAFSIAMLAVLFELIFGHKDINIFMALFVISFTVPLLRKFESNPMNKSIGYAILTLFGVLIILYYSPLNYIRNLQHSVSQKNVRDINVSKVTTIIQADDNVFLWNDENLSFYKQNWSQSHTISIPYKIQKSPSSLRFKSLDAGLSRYIPDIGAKEFGWDYLHNNAITAGDINHDGLLDLAISKPNSPIKIFINQGNNQFVDATSQLFAQKIPFNIAILGLADFNNDSYLDLILLADGYDTIQSNTIELFNPKTKQFEHDTTLTPKSMGTKGGFALHDLNHDGILDIYISNGIDFWDDTFITQGISSMGAKDELWLSNNKKWKQVTAYNLPYKDKNFVGMSVLFSDINSDGNIDFLLGNDRQPNITMLGDSEGNFHLIDKDMLEYNCLNSMSYFTVDMDNDGNFEIWENGISVPTGALRNRYKDFVKQTTYGKDALSREFERMQKKIRSGKVDCSEAVFPIIAQACIAKMALYKAGKLADIQECKAISNKVSHLECEFVATLRQIKQRKDPRKLKVDVEQYPKVIQTNTLLKQQASGNYVNVLQDFAALHSGWSWAAYPFDVNNDGNQDIYVTTGNLINYLRQPNALLINKNVGEITLHNEAISFGLDDFNESRGLIIADFDRDGDGDIVLNNVFGPPQYYENRTAGDSIQVTLRSKIGNYYALGAILKLHTTKGVQTRQIRVGGIWNSAQAAQAHFGIAADEEITYLEVIWPAGTKQKISHLKRNHLHIIYQ